LRLIDYAIEAAERWQQSGDNPQKLWPGEDAKEVLAALQRFGKKASPILQRFLSPQLLLIEQLNSNSLSHEDRLLIGQRLAEFGDPRPGVGLRTDGVPDIEWLEIPQGDIKLESIGHVFEVKSLSHGEISSHQFLTADDGYRYDKWWKGIKQSKGAAQSKWLEANCPRERVSWFEAVTFCRWLSHRTGSRIRLPTEWEWQQAASGGDPNGDYPWPGGWDASRCNNTESRLNRTTAVGMYPSGKTEHGVLDMAGNVWEWCLNTYEKPETSESVHIDESNAKRVDRGGSWNDGPVYLRASGRHGDYVGKPLSVIGFRLAQEID
jgi:hypothetical protein